MNASLVKLHLEVYMNGTCQAHVEMLRSLVAELFFCYPHYNYMCTGLQAGASSTLSNKAGY